MQILKFDPGHVIFLEGQEGHTAYRILSGLVEIFISRDGGEITLAQLGPGDIFGEMAIVEDKPRSASARTVESSELEALTEYDFNEMILTRPTMLLPYLASFFERLRNANEQLRKTAAGGPERPSLLHAPPPGKIIQVRISAQNPDITPNGSMAVNKFPFRIGRASRTGEFDVLFTNDYPVIDKEPYNVSRNQCSIEREGNSFYIRDRGSRLGSIVNGSAIGSGQSKMTAPLKMGENEVILGKAGSPARLMIHLT